MKIDIQKALTNSDCTTALSLGGQLYNSAYSDNETRLLYASAHGCNIGLNLYDLIDELANFNTSNPIGEFAHFFPSTSTDSRMASSWYAQDALEAMLNGGTVLAPADEIYPTSYNIGSVLVNDRTEDSNAYMMFIGMAAIGTALNRYGNPSATYTQGTTLPWETQALIKSDTTGAGCALASAFLNFFDGANASIGYLTASLGSQVTTILTLLETPITQTDLVRNTYGGNAHCLNDGFTQVQCTAALQRLRYRGACAEQDAAASTAAGIIGAVNDLWL